MRAVRRARPGPLATAGRACHRRGACPPAPRPGGRAPARSARRRRGRRCRRRSARQHGCAARARLLGRASRGAGRHDGSPYRTRVHARSGRRADPDGPMRAGGRGRPRRLRDAAHADRRTAPMEAPGLEAALDGGDLAESLGALTENAPSEFIGSGRLSERAPPVFGSFIAASGLGSPRMVLAGLSFSSGRSRPPRARTRPGRVRRSDSR